MSGNLRAALFDRWNVLTLALAIGGGLLAAWWLLPIGLVVWIIMIAVTLKEPGRS
jgi:hypothetical protein